MKCIFLIVLILSFLSGCLEVENQDLATPAGRQAVNPAPAVRDFRANNARHKILMAVLDSGVDYNQPVLLNNIHFELDQNGKPTGLGYDFLGHDPWPAPYIARTYDRDSDALELDREGSAKRRKILTRMIARNPKLAPFLDPERAVESESPFLFHGTAVGALMTFDQPELGLLVYRTLPVNSKWQKGELDKEEPYLRSASQIADAMELAAKSGARVINMSFAIRVEDVPEKARGNFPGWVARLVSIIKRYPSVAFVAAAGNDYGQLVDVNHPQLPCGVALDNLLCVTATDREGKRADFSNIVDAKLAQIGAPGVDVVSAYPTLMCESGIYPTLWALNLLDLLMGQDSLPEDPLNDCLTPHFKADSGSSYSAPLASRELGLLFLADPTQTGHQAIQALIHKFPNGIPYTSPSWIK